MAMTNRIRTLLLTLVLTALAACSPPGTLDISAANSVGVMNLLTPEGQVLSSGQPTEEEFRLLADAGVKHIINLRPAAEQADFDEAAVVRALGMEYHNLPIAGAPDVTAANAQTLDQLLSTLNGEPVLVHCASGNRVGALRALTANAGGLDVDAAIAEGERWGLAAMTPAVRTILSGN